MNGFHAIGRLAVLATGLAAWPGVVVRLRQRSSLLPGCRCRWRRSPSHRQGPRQPVCRGRPAGTDTRRCRIRTRVHAALGGTIPGWQLTLMAVTIVLLAATVVAIVYPGPRGSG